VLNRDDELPAFVEDDPERAGVVATRHEIGWRDWSVSVPVPMLSPVGIRDLFSDRNLGPKDVTFSRLAAVSNGNLGVATAIWEARKGSEVRPSDMTVPEPDRDLNREEAFCLRIVLAKERVKREQLSTIIDTLDRVLGASRAPASSRSKTILGTGTGGSAGRRDGDRTGADTVTVLQGLVDIGIAQETLTRMAGVLVAAYLATWSSGTCSRRSPSAFPADGSASRLLFRSRGFSSSEPRRIWSWDRCSDYRPHSCSQCRDCSGRLWGSA